MTVKKNLAHHTQRQEVVETVQNDLCETAIGPNPSDGSSVEGSTIRATITDPVAAEDAGYGTRC